MPAGKGDPSLSEEVHRWGSTVYERGGLPYPEIAKTRCMREALLNGIGSGLPVGVLGFLHTKNIMVGCRAAVGACIVVGLGSWEYCKYNHRKQMEMVKQTVDALNRSNPGGPPPGSKP